MKFLKYFCHLQIFWQNEECGLMTRTRPSIKTEALAASGEILTHIGLECLKCQDHHLNIITYEINSTWISFAMINARYLDIKCQLNVYLVFIWRYSHLEQSCKPPWSSWWCSQSLSSGWLHSRLLQLPPCPSFFAILQESWTHLC